MNEANDTQATEDPARCAAPAGSLPKRQQSRFLKATKAMMDALDAAEGMTARELVCFQHNTQQFIEGMIVDATTKEAAMKLPMRRHDWGKGENATLSHEEGGKEQP